MKGLREELIISGDNVELVSYLSKMACAILEQSIDVKNIAVSTVGDTEPNVMLKYTRHPNGMGWRTLQELGK